MGAFLNWCTGSWIKDGHPPSNGVLQVEDERMGAF